MTYFIAAWIVDAEITLVESDTSPIVQNHAPDTPFDFRVIAEVDGEYQDAGVVLPLLSWDGKALSGVPIISQHVETSTM
jgi:hypothetical protein